MDLIILYLIVLFKSLGYLSVFFAIAVIALKLCIEPVKGKCKCDRKLRGKTALITGGNSGIGLETARDLARRGARVIIASRNEKKSSEAVIDIQETTGNKQVEYYYLNLAKFSSIRAFAAKINENVDRIDILVNNAGCGGVPMEPTEDGIDRVMQINYLGPFLLTNLLLDKVIASKPSRVVIVASIAHELATIAVDSFEKNKSYFYFKAYANSKLCDVLWMRALSRRLPEGVTVNALHPGVVYTNIFRYVPSVTRKLLLAVIRAVFKTAQEGAQTTIHCCVAPELENVTGEYFSDCKIHRTSKTAANEDLAEQLWTRSLMLTKQGLGRTGVLIACYLVYSLRVRANDAIRLVRRKRPRSVQTSGQILCVQQFEHYLLPQTVVFSSKESLHLTKDPKTAEFTIKQYLHRQRATLHGLEERAFRELPMIVFCLCERLLKLCGCQRSIGLDLRIKNLPFYKSFLVYRLKKNKLPDPMTPEETTTIPDQATTLPMLEWRDPVEEEVERNLETVSRITGSSQGSIPSLKVYEALIIDHHSLPEERQKYLKQLKNDINQRKEAFFKIEEEEDPAILTGLLFEWLEGLKHPVLDRDDLSIIVGRGHNVESCVLALQMEDAMLLEYLLRFVIRLHPLAGKKKVDIIRRLISSLTHQTTAINGKCLPTRRDFQRLRDGTTSQVINFMLRTIVEIQKDMAKPGRDDADVVVPKRFRIKAWK